jgi:hypothetical protein
MPTPNIYFKIVIGFGIALLIFCGGVYVEHLRFVAYKEKVVAEGRVQEEHNQDLVKQQQLVTEKVTNDYKNQIARIKFNYDSLRLASGSDLSKPSNTLVSINGYTTDPVFAEQCASATAQLIGLQAFVKEQLGLK